MGWVNRMGGDECCSERREAYIGQGWLYFLRTLLVSVIDKTRVRKIHHANSDCFEVFIDTMNRILLGARSEPHEYYNSQINQTNET